MKLHKGDQVIVLSGKDKGKTGKITRLLPQLNKVVIDGINTVTRHVKPSAKHPRGGIIQESQALWASKVAVVHPTKPKRGSRIGYEIKKDGTKTRVYRQAGNKEIKQ